MTCNTVITRKRGDTYPEQITVVDEDTGEALDIAGASFKLTVNSDQNPTDETTQLFQIVGAIVVAADGTVKFTPTAGNAAVVGNNYFDVEMTSSGEVTTVMAGSWNVGQDITKT